MEDLNGMKNQLISTNTLLQIFKESYHCKKDNEMTRLVNETIKSIADLTNHIDEVITKEASIYSED